MAANDIVVTSYALIRRDAERYRELEFDTVVLDEAQHIKNRQTQNAQAVKAVKARHRIVLTGTPLENSVLDLWSIFDFLMPGYLGTAQDFRERYELPIAKEKERRGPDAAGATVAAVHVAAAQEGGGVRSAGEARTGFLLRIDAGSAQRLSASHRSEPQGSAGSRRRAGHRQEPHGGADRVAAAAPGLLRLAIVEAAKSGVTGERMRKSQNRLSCPESRRSPTHPSPSSGKLDLFGELLEEVIDGGHRLLVFSQFVGMLTLLKEKLTAEGIEFCYLDGSTTDRAGVVERFQTNATIPVFLISLKAGGVGLNLTGADTVIHFDPWWNPAVEDQATDRAHRIGQTKVVTSYKLITRDTVEEKILTLQNRKREIIQATIGGEEEFAASLSWEEIQELLA